MASKHKEFSVEEAKEELAKIFGSIEEERTKWDKDQESALAPVEKEMDKCIKDNCMALHKAA